MGNIYIPNVSKYLSTNVPDISNMSPGHFKKCLNIDMGNIKGGENPFWENRFWEKPCFMYGTSGVIHVWYIRCDRDAAAAGQPPGQPSHPAGRGPGPGCLRGPRGPRQIFSMSKISHVGQNPTNVTFPIRLCL